MQWAAHNSPARFLAFIVVFEVAMMLIFVVFSNLSHYCSHRHIRAHRHRSTHCHFSSHHPRYDKIGCCAQKVTLSFDEPPKLVLTVEVMFGFDLWFVIF